MKYFNLIFLLVIFIVSEFNVEGRLFEYFRWKQIEYADLPESVIIPNESEIPNFTNYNATSYIPYSNLPVSVERYKNRVFITVPRRRIGIPSTLNFVTISSQGIPEDQSPPLNSYPDYKTNEIPLDLQPNPDRIISVYRPRVDECGRLWFIDTGMFEYPNYRQQIQRPAIWIMDLETNQRIRRFEIPESVAPRGDGFISIAVDISRNNCDDAYAYIPNMRTFTISVYSFRRNQLWTFRHNSFYLEPRGGDFDIQGFQYQWNDGIFSIAVGLPNKQTGCKNIYYHALASLGEYTVSSCVLKNETLAARLYHGNDFKYLGSRDVKWQSTAHAIDKLTGIMISSHVQLNTVACWNIKQPFNNMNFGTVERNEVTMIYPSDLKIDSDSNIWVLTNRIPIYGYSRLDTNDYNYRVMFSTMGEAVRGTVCSRPNILPILGPPS